MKIIAVCLSSLFDNTCKRSPSLKRRQVELCKGLQNNDYDVEHWVQMRFLDCNQG
uniref:Uncharacterized protein n=1 Tax=Kalanchoe fedtschenkoi TaxID=63787 RepID=A0A7N0V9L4_KALFE